MFIVKFILLHIVAQSVYVVATKTNWMHTMYFHMSVDIIRQYHSTNSFLMCVAPKVILNYLTLSVLMNVIPESRCAH
jgi:hypothetical protein